MQEGWKDCKTEGVFFVELSSQYVLNLGASNRLQSVSVERRDNVVR
jgi:hypothetical protein